MNFPFSQVIVNALALGSFYVLAASGMSLLFGVSRIFNFAHGEFYMLGAFTTFFIYGVWGLNYFLTLLISMFLMGLVGMLTERFLFRKISGGEVTASLVVSFGLSMVLSGGALQIWGERDRSVLPVFSGNLSMAGFSIPYEKLCIIIASIIIMVVLWIFIQKTNQGRAIRATSQDREVAVIFGVKYNRISLLSFGISTALAGAAGVLMAPVYLVEPMMGHGIILKLLIVIVLGGLGTIQGAAVGGIVLGFVEGFSVTFLGGLGQIPGFIVLVIILLVRPWGLVGIKE